VAGIALFKVKKEPEEIAFSEAPDFLECFTNGRKARTAQWDTFNFWIYLGNSGLFELPHE